MASVEVRPMRASDGPAVARLAGELGYPSTPDEVDERFRSLAGDAEHQVLVAEREGAVVGWVHVHGTRLLVADPRAEIGGLVVASGAARSGVGRLLVAPAEEWAAKRGYRGIRVRSNVVRREAHGFYEALGYRTEKTSLIFEKDL